MTNSDEIAQDHPIQTLLFFASEDIPESTKGKIETMLNDLAVSREWVIGPPWFVHSVEEPERPGPDLSVETVGGALELYSAHSPWKLPHEIDRLHLSEAESLIGAVQKFSLEHGVSFDFELDGDFVGEIRNGVQDDHLREVFIGPWREGLGE
jgi:hypothetical protein